MYLILATYNRHKYEEMLELMPYSIHLVSLEHEKIPIQIIHETGSTFAENALLKVRTVAQYKPYNAIIADDSGLEVFSLNGKPGIYSARYAGKNATDEENIEKLLKELKNTTDRRARFKCCIAYKQGKTEYIFEGVVEGTIINEKRGSNGFGYDSVFVPDGYNQTFAEMPTSLKNQISHRAIAVKNLIEFLQEKKLIYCPIKFEHTHGITTIYFDHVELHLNKLAKQKHVIVIDKKVNKLFPEIFSNFNNKFLLTAIEEKKSLRTVERIYEFFYQNDVDRNTYAIVVGGGITTDVGAFAASTWKRGCKLVLVPTTAMAMADAAIGGKTAVNYKNTKNLIGTFYQPESIIIDSYFLNKLPKDIKDLAFSEIIKHVIGFDANYFKQLIKRIKHSYNPDGANFHIEEIHKSIEIKINIVKQDPEEHHFRKLLNIGHTVGHAIETAYQIPHGEAIFIGMLLELKTFKLLGLLNSNKPIDMLQDVYNYTHLLNNPLKIKFEDILPYIVHDKKKNNNNITIPVVKEIGQTELCEISMNNFLEALKITINEIVKD